MALAYGSFQELSNQLRFLLFEIGIGLPQKSIDYFINLAHRKTLKRLQHAAYSEKLTNSAITSHHVHDFVDQLQCQLKKTTPESQFYQWSALREDINESIANEALGLAYQYNRNTALKKELRTNRSLWQWLSTEISNQHAFLFLEQWGYHRQNYLPASFARKGYSRREVLQSSAEFQAKITAHWCALHKKEIQYRADLNVYTQLIKQEFSTEYLLWREKIRHQRLCPDDYYPVPIHPYQWRKELQKVFAPLTDAKLLLLYPNHQSLMVLPENYLLPSNKSQCLIKLADHGSLTSMPNAIDSRVLHKLNTVLESTSNFQNTLYLNLQLAELKLRNDALPDNFSVSLHKNPVCILKPEQRALPLTRLFMQSPISEKPLLAEIIESSDLGPLEFFAEYCDKLLSGPINLMLKHEIILNLQTEDVYVIFENNRSSGIIIRNISQLESYEDIHQAPGLPLHNLEQLNLSFIQSYFINNLNAWIQFLNDYYHIPPTRLWRITRQHVEKHIDHLSGELDAKIVSQQKFLILNSHWQTESRFQMSLHPMKNKRIMMKMTNYLAQ